MLMEYELEAGQTIDEIIDSFMYDNDHLNIIFRKPCGYNYLRKFTKSTDIIDVWKYIQEYYGSTEPKLYMKNKELPQTGKLYDYIVKNNITSVPIKGKGTFYLITLENIYIQ